MLESTLQWRKEVDIPSICKNWKGTIELENSTGKAYVRGSDKMGRALTILRPSAENTFDYDGNIQHLIFTMEKAVACTERNGQQKLSFLIDFDGYSIFNAPSISTTHQSIHILQNHYPERLHRTYFVRPPSIFYGLFKMFESFIDKATLEKVCFLSEEDMAEPNNQLFTDVDKSVLESSFGGKDRHPFRSDNYLRGGFSDDYIATLTKRKAKALH